MMDIIPLPPANPVNLPAALRNMWRLIRNKEDTRLVFEVVRHVSGKSSYPAFHEFCASDYGRSIIADPGRHLRLMDDREGLRSLPVGTFGRAYADFMDREGLFTNGVYEAAREAGFGLEEFEKDYPEYHTFRHVIMLTHDLYHIITGYGRDGLGEAALLAFTHEQHGENGAAFIAFFAGLKVRSERFDIPVGQIMKEAREMGRASARFLCTDLTEMLDWPLEEVRRTLNVGPAPLYASIPQDVLDSLALPQAA